MTLSYRSLFLATSIFLAPAVGALAQTAGTSTADGARLGTPSPTGNPALSGSTAPTPGGVTASQHPGVSGATGRTVVPGNNSSIAGDRAGTAMGKTDGVGGGSGGGSGK
jgi:hypothetical protein